MADRNRPQAKPQRKAVTAAAQVVTSRSIKQRVEENGALLGWQNEAIANYDSVGEFRFGVDWVANGLSRVNIVAAKPPKAHGEDPTPLDPNATDLTASQRRAIELVSFLGGGATGMGQLLGQTGRLLTVTGLAWLVAETGTPDENAAALGDTLLDAEGDLIPEGERPPVDTFETWNAYAQNMLKTEDRIDPETGDPMSVFFVATGKSGTDAWRELNPNSIVIKCWRPHPFRPWEPDASVRAVLGVLKQIKLIQEHITASATSRLAGAGLLAVPAEADFPAPPPLENGDPNPLTPFQYFMEQLWDAIITPIGDRENASAVAPVGIAIPGEYIEKLKHLTFATPFDEHAIENLTEAIERFALGMDMPPEVLTGMGDTNHWNAWQIQDTSITLHIDPTAELVVGAWTEGYLKPALEAENFNPDEAIIWYDTSDLTQPPDLSANATLAYEKMLISGAAYLDYLGLSIEDMPDDVEKRIRILLEVARGAPTLAPAMLAEAGFLDPAVAEAAASVPAAEADAPAGPAEPAATPQPTQEQTGPPEQATNAKVIVAACDGIVVRAMERAGAKLKSSIGKVDGGGPQAVTCDPATLHTRYDATAYASLDSLLTGAFDRVPDVAEFCGVNADALAADLDIYCRSLLAHKVPHDRHRLAAALSVHAS